jgi:hypothetical protein
VLAAAGTARHLHERDGRPHREPAGGGRRPSVMRRLFLAAITCAVLVAPVPAAASCAAPTGPPVPADHEHVFAGLVERTTNGGAVAEVRVLDVWHGPDLPPRIVVVGGQLQRGVESSVDRSYRAGDRYAFFVHRTNDGSLRDNACTPTAPLSSLVALDPAGIRAPDPSAVAPTDPRGPLTTSGHARVAGGTALALLVTAVILAHWRTRRGSAL